MVYCLRRSLTGGDLLHLLSHLERWNQLYIHQWLKKKSLAVTLCKLAHISPIFILQQLTSHEISKQDRSYLCFWVNKELDYIYFMSNLIKCLHSEHVASHGLEHCGQEGHCVASAFLYSQHSVNERTYCLIFRYPTVWGHCCHNLHLIKHCICLTGDRWVFYYVVMLFDVALFCENKQGCPCLFQNLYVPFRINSVVTNVHVNPRAVTHLHTITDAGFSPLAQSGQHRWFPKTISYVDSLDECTSHGSII